MSSGFSAAPSAAAPSTSPHLSAAKSTVPLKRLPFVCAMRSACLSAAAEPSVRIARLAPARSAESPTTPDPQPISKTRLPRTSSAHAPPPSRSVAKATPAPQRLAPLVSTFASSWKSSRAEAIKRPWMSMTPSWAETGHPTATMIEAVPLPSGRYPAMSRLATRGPGGDSGARRESGSVFGSLRRISLNLIDEGPFPTSHWQNLPSIPIERVIIIAVAAASSSRASRRSC
mmetsp:Transcript_26433/g.88896  ORF Transcript_26433/g.88896 Transcript_26433/m.88896 type:complete len:230 (+) Transcript_26433:381-1070(+)